jgi:hypothetical protein
MEQEEKFNQFLPQRKHNASPLKRLTGLGEIIFFIL